MRPVLSFRDGKIENFGELMAGVSAGETRQGEAKLRARLLEGYGIEVGGGLGKLAGHIWRVGLMGENARITNVEALLSALRREL